MSYSYLWTSMRNFTLIFIAALIFSLNGNAQTNSAPVYQNAARIVKFFPNPATTYINFEFRNLLEKNHTLQIYNFLGKKILDMQELNPRVQVNLTNYTRGVYIFQVKDKTGKVVESGKFHIEK